MSVVLLSAIYLAISIYLELEYTIENQKGGILQ